MIRGLLTDLSSLLSGQSLQKTEPMKSRTHWFHNRPRTFDLVPLDFTFCVTPSTNKPPWANGRMFPFFLLVSTKIIRQITHPVQAFISWIGIPEVSRCEYHELGDPITVHGSLRPCLRRIVITNYIIFDRLFGLMDKVMSLLFDHQYISPLTDMIAMTFLTSVFVCD